LSDTGCLFVTTAVESLDDEVLKRLDKGHTRADFFAVVRLFREIGLIIHPTFVPFTPWISLTGYGDLLITLAEEELVANVAPIQLGIRLLIPAGSRLLELDEVRQHVGDFDPAALVFPWKHADARVDQLAARVQELAAEGNQLGASREETFGRIWAATAQAQSDCGLHERQGCLGPVPALQNRVVIPHLNENWYCCAEPTADQFVSIAGCSQPVSNAVAYV
jgi:hypothetical protein